MRTLRFHPVLLLATAVLLAAPFTRAQTTTLNDEQVYPTTADYFPGDVVFGTGNVSVLYDRDTLSAQTVTTNFTVDSDGDGATLGTNPESFDTTFVDFNGDIVLNRPTTLVDAGTNSSGRTSFHGALSGNVGTLTIQGGRLTLDNATGLVGDVVVADDSMLQLNNINGETANPVSVLSTAANLTLNSGSRLYLVGGQIIGSLSSSSSDSAITVYSNRSITLQVGANNQSTTYAGSITSAKLDKIGTGTLTLTGYADSTRDVTVSAGTLVVDGFAAADASVLVKNGATLGGHGTVGELIVSGTLSPGNSPGTLHAGSTTWNAGGSYLWEINDATGTAGTNWDLLDTNGTLDLTSLTTGSFTIALNSLGADNNPGNAENFNLSQPYSWIIVSASGGINGFDARDFHIDTSGFTNPSSDRFAITQDGNTLLLTYSAVPEPMQWGVAIGLGLFALAATRRKK